MSRLPYPAHLFGHRCPCAACVPEDADPFDFASMMHLCPQCGNKRCPGAVDHTRTCSGSNEPGQVGSFYESVRVPFDPCVEKCLGSAGEIEEDESG